MDNQIKPQFNPQYLYTFHDDIDGQTAGSIFLYPVRKITQRFVYVERRIWGHWKPVSGDVPMTDIFTSEGTYRLDRQALERDGYAGLGKSLGGWWLNDYYVSPEELYKKHFQPTPDYLKQLGLMLPCTSLDARQAYKRLAKEYHPDTGGDAVRFMALQRSYEQAIKYLEGAR